MTYLRSAQSATHLQKPEEMFNRLIYIDDSKIFSKNENQVETLVRRMHNKNIGMEFGIENVVCW